MSKDKFTRIELYKIKRKNPILAVILTLLITGMGHMYLGKWGKGFGHLFVQMLLWIVLLGWIMWIVSPIMVYKDAKLHNLTLLKELDLTEDDVL